MRQRHHEIGDARHVVELNCGRLAFDPLVGEHAFGRGQPIERLRILGIEVHHRTRPKPSSERVRCP